MKAPQYPILLYKKSSITGKRPFPAHAFIIAFCAVILLLCVCSKDVTAASFDSLSVHTDLPFIDSKGYLSEDIFYQSLTVFKASFEVRIYKYAAENDSILVARGYDPKQSFKSGVNHIQLVFKPSDTAVLVNPKFFTIIKATGTPPPGDYKTYITIEGVADTFKSVHIGKVDSNLSATSPVRKQINRRLLPQGKSFAGISLQSNLGDKYGSAAHRLFGPIHRMERALKFKNLTPVTYDKGHNTDIDFYYQDWFAGRYVLKKDESLTSQIKAQNQAATSSLNSMNPNDLDDFQSLFSKFRSIKKNQQGNNEMTGQLSLATTLSTGQEEYSGIDNNYYELTGDIEVPVFGMPVAIEGYYTSQDNHRNVKSSYIHFHYDADKAKSQLTSLMSSYNQKYSEVLSKGQGLQQVYGNYLNTLQGQKAQIQNEIDNELHNQDNLPQLNTTTTSLQSNLTGEVQSNLNSNIQNLEQDTTQLKNKLAGKVDSNKTVAKVTDKEKQVKASIAAKKKHLEDAYNRLQQIEKTIDKYQALLNQYRNTAYFDSAVGAGKFQHMDYSDQSSYKDLAKQEANILPDGKAKTFIAGITNFDAGMFPKEQSQFTMAGQMLKGLDAGYDFGIFKEGVTVGKTQFIGADGNIDQYTCYSAKTTLKEIARQSVSFIYYGYTVDKKLLSNDNFFKDASISTPSFFQPVNIFSLDYKGKVYRFATVNAEAATSLYQSQNNNSISKNNKAWHIDIDGNIPYTNISVITSYDNVGLGFKNSTLPIIPSGTEEYKAALKNTFFRNYLTAGVEFDHFIQNNFSYKGMNNKWGFDVQTHSKKYPNIVLSYKPFTTFTSYADTLNIPERPMIGAVWTGRGSYNLRSHDGKTLNFSMLYNKSSSDIDTTRYDNNLMQLMCMYMNGENMLSVSLSNITQSSVNTGLVVTAPANMDLLSLMGNISMNRQISINGGQDIGVARFGLCKYSVNGGIRYRFDKMPIDIRANVRYTTYELNADQSWQTLYSGYMEVTWRFKTKLLTRPNL